MEDLAGLAPGRPRRRPLGASTVSCGRRCRVTRSAQRESHFPTRAQATTATTPRRRVCRMRPPARPREAGHANLASKQRSSSASNQDGASPSAGSGGWRATLMRPRESEGSSRRTRMTTGGAAEASPERRLRTAIVGARHPPDPADGRPTKRPTASRSKPERRNRQPPARATQKKATPKAPPFSHPKQSGNHRLPFCFSCDKSRTAPRSADVANAA